MQIKYYSSFPFLFTFIFSLIFSFFFYSVHVVVGVASMPAGLLFFFAMSTVPALIFLFFIFRSLTWYVFRFELFAWVRPIGQPAPNNLNFKIHFCFVCSSIGGTVCTASHCQCWTFVSGEKGLIFSTSVLISTNFPIQWWNSRTLSHGFNFIFIGTSGRYTQKSQIKSCL